MSENEADGADASLDAGEDPEIAELRAANKQLLQELEDKHGELRLIRAPKFLGGGLIVVATPKRTAWHKFVNDIRNEKMSATIVSETLAYSATVYPDRDTLKQYFESKPAIPQILSVAAQRLATGGAEDLGKD